MSAGHLTPHGGVRAGFLGVAFALSLAVCGVQAEMSGDDYISTTPLASPQERRRANAEVEAAKVQAETDASRQRMQEGQRQMLEARRLAQRPLGERLLDSRCVACHSLSVLDHNVKSPLGWRWTVERMRWWHGAKLSTEEVRQVSTHLALARAGGRGWVDAGIIIGLVGAVAVLGGLACTGCRHLKSRPKEST